MCAWELLWNIPCDVEKYICKVTECVLGNSCGIYPVMWKNIYVKSQNVCLGTLVEYTLSCGKIYM